MRIEPDLKLDFGDVLIRPKRSTLSTRNSVDLYREFNFRNTQVKADNPENAEYGYRGIPIMAANMDGVATFEMAEALAKNGMFTCLVKHYPKHELRLWIEEVGSNIKDNWAYSMGISEIDLSKFDAVYSAIPAGSMKFVSIDVANGYTEGFVEFVRRFKDKYPELVLIAGNVVTGEMTEELIISGVDIVKVGIGPGCFVPGQKVQTSNGLKNIEEISIGEKVLTHMGRFKPVTNTFRFDDKKTVVNVNGIKATPNHEFYVLHKKYKDVVNDSNIHQLSEWIEAKNLTKDYFLLKIK